MILRAAAEELADAGYPGMTLDRVAARAGTSKNAIYRHWPSRAALGVAAYHPRQPSSSRLAARRISGFSVNGDWLHTAAGSDAIKTINLLEGTTSTVKPLACSGRAARISVHTEDRRWSRLTSLTTRQDTWMARYDAHGDRAQRSSAPYYEPRPTSWPRTVMTASR
ncbi:TetR/AcrR family transcriptional regulator [Actinoallomurus sp. NBC_01490]|uniref:helix-turn-helix domain-containing protein n=1 Tax=Actinoallomurus sp. NBC_01490 TaxID=2903557 RepID=UPI002E371E2E|nr:helix-turn-helix domain-containing protein [Actinoallomurus sp. NBC_01490]